ncbi:MAG TPA: allantoinase AllB [Thermoanaerobaculia bacterium]|nr:allantoinase AllB [Thermoanaerobaculia bacterium]
MPPFALRSRRVVTPAGTRAATLSIADGVVTAVLAYGETPAGLPLIDCGEAAVLPGVVDSHVHVNDPGRAEWEGFPTATRAAAAGGVTTLVDMPLNSIPATTTVEALGQKRAAAEGRSYVDVAFWGGVVPANAADLPVLTGLAAAGVRGFKAFLVPSGVDEFPAVGEPELRTALPILAGLGLPLLVHAELPGPITAASRNWTELESYRAYLASRPEGAEVAAIRLLLDLAAATGARIHVVHLSAAAALPFLAAARLRGLPVTVETCPHYLTFAAEEIADGATEWKCAPPIRGRENRERLWAALAAREIDLVASDHSPSPPALKHRESGDFSRAWGGIASLQLTLSAFWTEARKRGFTLDDLARLMSRAPAELAGFGDRKGAIAPGYDADLVVFDSEASFRVEPERLEHRHKLTPYAGRVLDGVVLTTYLRGEPVYDRGRFSDPPRGRVL